MFLDGLETVGEQVEDELEDFRFAACFVETEQRRFLDRFHLVVPAHLDQLVFDRVGEHRAVELAQNVASDRALFRNSRVQKLGQNFVRFWISRRSFFQKFHRYYVLLLLVMLFFITLEFRSTKYVVLGY